MAGIFGAYVMSYLRLLTPHEVDRLIQTSEKREKVKLSELITEDDALDIRSAHKNFYGLKSKNSDEEVIVREDSEEQNNEANDNTNETTKKVIYRKPTPQNLRFDLKLKEKQSFSSFLLDQKRKMAESQKKLKGKEVLKLYDISKKVDVNSRDNEESEDDENHDLNSITGVFINKKTG